MDGQSRKIAAALTAAVFLLSAFAIIAPAQAHFTLGNLSATSPYDINNFDPHVAGPIGYVWPGSGECAYDGFPNEASDNCAPGYQSPYPNGNPPGAPDNSWYQLQGDTYSPFGAVLTNSTGDLIFAINATCTPSYWNNPLGCSTESGHDNGVRKAEIQQPELELGWDTWLILVPPEFNVPGAATHDSSQITSTLTNSYNRILVAKLGSEDRYAPGWTLIAVSVDAASDFTGSLSLTYFHQYIQFTRAGEWYYVRVNGVTAPSVAGRYFFKMALSSDISNMFDIFSYGVGPTLGGPPGVSPIIPENGFVWVPPENWPVLLVKGEVDPAILTGTIRYGGYNATLYGQPVGEAGRVYAKMTTRLDPYTGEARLDLPLVDAAGYFNATAHGHYEVEGLAPGVYDLYASAAGYPQTLCASGVTVLRGQSLHLNCYLQPGPVIHSNVFTKHQFGDEPWPESDDSGQYVKIELYDNPTLSNQVDSSAGSPVSWSPLPCTAGGQEEYIGRGAAGLCGDPRDGSAIAFPWHEYSTDANVMTQPNVNGFRRDVSESGVCLAGNLNCQFLTSDPEGVGPPQQWYVAGGTTTPFHFEFGVKGEYGAPRDLSGEVPQVYATWINGLTPGRYYVRAWTFRYVQTGLDGSTFQEYYFDVTPNEWAGDVTVPIDLRLSSWVNKTVHFHDTNDTLTEDPIHTVSGYLWGYLTGADGHVYSYNVTGLGYNSNYYYDSGACSFYDEFSYNAFLFGSNSNSFTSYGLFKGSGEDGAPSISCPVVKGFGSALDKSGVNRDSIASGRAVIQFWGINDTWGGENYGIPSGTYTPTVAAQGYYSQSPSEQVSVTLSGNPTSISDHMLLGPGFNVSVYSIDWERPTVNRDWIWSGCQSFVLFTCAGSEIDVGFYPAANETGGRLADWFGFEPSYMPLSVADDGGLFQGPGGTDCLNPTLPYAFNCVEMDGGGRDVLQGYGNSHNVFYGQSARYAYQGGYTPGIFGFLTANTLLTDSMFTTPLLTMPLHFKEGQYDLAAYTYGYVQDQTFTAYAMNGQVADMRLNLMVGVNVTLDILFKKEGIITPTFGNMSARVRLFNDQGQLVSEWMSSEGTYVDSTGHAIAANGQLPSNDAPVGFGITPLYPFIGQGGITYPWNNLNSYNFLPGGVTLLHVVLAGFPQHPALGGFITSKLPYLGSNNPIGGYFGDPLQGSGCDFELDCYPAAYAQYPFPYTGIMGSPDYVGGWTAEVDFVPLYGNNTGSAQTNCQTTLLGEMCFGPGDYYSPVDGLLMGESYHIIPGTTATSGISLTEDLAENSYFVGHSMAANHLGPYSQEGTWEISGAHNSGEASGIFQVDLNGFVSGNVLAFTWSNEFRTLSWGTISVTGASGATWPFNTYDGVYQMFLPAGDYKFSIAEPGYAPQTWSVSVSPGQSGTGQNVYLEQSNIPVPEFSGVAVVAFSVLAASVYLLKRRRK
ncbi:MAG TPA: carboxypeptidase-like regulatory domain-containing protein [Candidatus Acidoferrales bacterium]|nr:carboxypeptidase-like regulatory domain-containing protein [Candidatus Acidoferrales bacterium]